MAGDWIPIEVDVARKREVCILATRLKCSRHEVVGWLVEFWGWCQKQTEDGALSGMGQEHLAAVFPDIPPGLWSGLESVGWVHAEAEGMRVMNFHRWLGRGAKARLKLAERVSRYRAKQAAESGNGSKAPKPRAARRAPEDFDLTPERLAFAVEHGLTVVEAEREFDTLCDFEFARAYTDWNAVWQNWVRREEKLRAMKKRGAR